MTVRSDWPLARQNANRSRQDDLAKALRDAWHRGDQSWIDLAILAIQTLQPGRADADAVFTIELHHNRSSTHIVASWGGDPESMIRRGIEALESELTALRGCPFHTKSEVGVNG